jgi:hypothetical protein
MDAATTWTDRTRPKHNPPPRSKYQEDTSRKQFHRPHTSLGAAGHWVHMAAMLAPVVIGEVVADANKRWRYVRIASIGTALAYEALHTIREQQRQADREADRREHCRQ